MSTAREDILARIRAANRPGGRRDATAALREQLGRTEAQLLPARATGEGAALVDNFVSSAEQSGASVARVAGRSRVPAEIAAYLSRAGLGSDIVIAPHPLFEDMPWRAVPRLTLRRGRAAASDAVGVTPAVAGIAETGTLLVHSGATLPNTLYFLPETHIAVLREVDIVGAYEHAWDRMRHAVPAAEWPPRTATLITGPSRTSDIEKTLQIGVHGPRRLHIVVIDGEET